MGDNLVAGNIALFVKVAASFVEGLEGTPDKRSIAKKIRRFTEHIEAGAFDSEIEEMHMTYEEQKRMCAKHGFICLEDYRQHRAAVS